MSAKRLLVVDDDPGICDFISEVATDAGYQVSTANGHRQFKSLYDETEPNVIVMDLAMPDGDGVELLRFLGEMGSNAGVILMSGFDSKVLSSALRLGRDRGLNMLGTLSKPIDIDDLEAMLNTLPEPPGALTASDLVAALENEQLIVHYQPKVGLPMASPHRIAEAEALVRWNHPTLGLLTPDKFLPMAETEDLLRPLTLAVATQACEQMRQWDRQGLRMTVAINIAPQLLTDIALPDEITALTRRVGVENSRLVIEVIESGVMADPTTAMDILTRFRLKGFALAMDDFGTGYSSLIQLYRMPFSELKVDRSFVGDARHNEEARVIVEITRDLGHRLNLSVCAEGVEDAETLQLLTAMGCDKAQGYFIGKPMAGAVMTEFCAEKHSKRSAAQQ